MVDRQKGDCCGRSKLQTNKEVMQDNKQIAAHKIIVLGECNVGKTSIVQQYINKKFEHDTSTYNTSSSFFRKEVEVMDSK